MIFLVLVKTKLYLCIFHTCSCFYKNNMTLIGYFCLKNKFSAFVISSFYKNSGKQTVLPWFSRWGIEKSLSKISANQVWIFLTKNGLAFLTSFVHIAMNHPQSSFIVSANRYYILARIDSVELNLQYFISRTVLSLWQN